jgi:hypothetical protein
VLDVLAEATTYKQRQKQQRPLPASMNLNHPPQGPNQRQLQRRALRFIKIY